jgi:hypothetical protein
MMKWEYSRSFASFTWLLTPDCMSSLNAAGADGWELCGVAPHEETSEVVLLFKRQVPCEATAAPEVMEDE